MTHSEQYPRTEKRFDTNENKFPNNISLKKTIDTAILSMGAVGPLFTVPQLMRIWVERTTSGLSLFTWSAYFASSCIWFTYGIVHKEKPIIFANGMNIIVYALIVIGIILF